MPHTTIGKGWLHWRVVPPALAGTEASMAQPRLLLECRDQSAPAQLAHALAEAGFDVTVCSGPDASKRCALLEQGQCALVDDADVVVNALGTDEHEYYELLAATLAASETPVIVASSRPEVSVDERISHAGEMSPRAARDLDELLGQVQAAARRR